jgi:hypothetical protein
MFETLAGVLYATEHAMDWDLSADATNPHTDEQMAGMILDAVLKVCPDEWFPRGKWATIQAFQERANREAAKVEGDEAVQHGRLIERTEAAADRRRAGARVTGLLAYAVSPGLLNEAHARASINARNRIEDAIGAGARSLEEPAGMLPEASAPTRWEFWWPIGLFAAALVAVWLWVWVSL